MMDRRQGHPEFPWEPLVLHSSGMMFSTKNVLPSKFTF